METCRNDGTVDARRDSRIQSALSWCRAQRLKRVTLALPFSLQSQDVAWILAQPGVVSVILEPPVQIESGEHDSRTGLFDRANYDWTLPAELANRLIYLGEPEQLTARMLRALIVRRMRSIAFPAQGAWQEYSLARMVAAKIHGKMMALAYVVSDTIGKIDLLAVLLPQRPYRRLLRPFREAPPLASLALPGRIMFACPTLVAGGAERQIVTTVHGLVQRGIRDIHVVVSNLHDTTGNDFFLPVLRDAGIHVNELDRTQVPNRFRGGRRERISGNLPRHVVKRLRSIPEDLAQEVAALYIELVRTRPSVVHAWLDHSNVSAGLAALLAGVPRVILSGRNVSPRHFSYILRSCMRPAYGVITKRPEVVFVNNSRAGAADYAAWLDLPISRFQVIYNGVDLSRLRRASAEEIVTFRARYDVPPSAPLVGGMFRLSDEKRPMLWIETLRRVLSVRRDAHALIFGAGPLYATLAQEISRTGIGDRLRIVPPAHHHVVTLSAFDLLLLTSRWEGTPNVALEAQALGTAVVVTGEGGTREAISPGVTGLYVEDARPQALADAVLTLLDNQEQRQMMGSAGRRFVRHRFGVERMVAETIALYQMAR